MAATITWLKTGGGGGPDAVIVYLIILLMLQKTFQIGKEILSNSAKDIEYEKKRMEYVLEKQKRLQVK